MTDWTELLTVDELKKLNEYEIKDARIAELESQKNQAYSERNLLVAALSKVFPSSLERHSEEDSEWENDWRWIVFIDLPSGQASWHIHDSEYELFSHLPVKAGRVWDGHSTEEKYARLKAIGGFL